MGHWEKLFFMTLNNASANNVFVDLLTWEPMLKNALLNEAEFSHTLLLKILNVIAQDGLKKTTDCREKYRE